MRIDNYVAQPTDFDKPAYSDCVDEVLDLVKEQLHALDARDERTRRTLELLYVAVKALAARNDPLAAEKSEWEQHCTTCNECGDDY